MKILEIKVVQEADCAANVGIWNYWDPEHLGFVHAGYSPAPVLYETDKVCLELNTVRLPIFSFIRSRSIHAITRQDASTFVAYSTYFGIVSITTYVITDTSPDRSRYDITYKFFLETWWQKLCAPLIKAATLRWNERLWKEDLAVKLRRQKVLRYKFRDFVGLPEKIEDRNFAGEISLQLPVPRVPGNVADDHPYR